MIHGRLMISVCSKQLGYKISSWPTCSLTMPQFYVKCPRMISRLKIIMAAVHKFVRMLAERSFLVDFVYSEKHQEFDKILGFFKFNFCRMDWSSTAKKKKKVWRPWQIQTEYIQPSKRNSLQSMVFLSEFEFYSFKLCI